MSEAHRRRILRRGDAAEAASATLLVSVPSARAEQGATNSLQAMVDEARRQGRDEGYRTAMEQMEAAEATGRAAQLRRVADALVGAAASVHEARHQAVEMGAAEAAELAYALAEAFMQRELAVGRPAVEAVSRALHLIPDEQDIVVRLHPGEVIGADELREMVPDADVRVIEDPRIEPGGCLVVAGPCRIDTQIGSALDRARQILGELYGTPVPDRVEVPA